VLVILLEYAMVIQMDSAMELLGIESVQSLVEVLVQQMVTTKAHHSVRTTVHSMEHPMA